MLNRLQSVTIATHDAPRVQRAYVARPPQEALGQRPPFRPTLGLLRQQASDMQVCQHLRESLRRQQHVAQVILVELSLAADQLSHAPRAKLSSKIQHQPTQSCAELAQSLTIVTTQRTVEARA